MNFKFNIYKGKYRWENDEIRLEFSNPSGQAFNEYKVVKKIDDIMYLYYDVKISKNAVFYTEDDEEKHRWKEVASCAVYDFPAITALQNALKIILSNIDKKDCQKIKYPNGTTICQYQIDVTGLLNEDHYILTKTFGQCKSRYNIYIGCQANYQTSTTQGIYLNNLTKKDILELEKCVCGFLDFTVKTFSDSFFNMVAVHESMFKIIDNKLYEYEINYETGDITNNIETIFSVGDKIELTLINSDKEDQKLEIVDINKNTFSVSNGSEKFNIEPKNIGFIHKIINDDFLYYNLTKCQEVFEKIIDNKIKEDFINLDIDSLFEKYNSAISSETWMYRDEHNFPILNIDHHLSVDENIKQIIINIKQKLSA